MKFNDNFHIWVNRPFNFFITNVEQTSFFCRIFPGKKNYKCFVQSEVQHCIYLHSWFIYCELRSRNTVSNATLHFETCSVFPTHICDLECDLLMWPFIKPYCNIDFVSTLCSPSKNTVYVLFLKYYILYLLVANPGLIAFCSLVLAVVCPDIWDQQPCDSQQNSAIWFTKQVNKLRINIWGLPPQRATERLSRQLFWFSSHFKCR